MSDTVLIGWYSAKQRNLGVASAWKTFSGDAVTITEVIPKGERSLWDDAHIVGPVSEWAYRIDYGALGKPTMKVNW